MVKKLLIESIAQEVRQQMEGEGTGHDWWHIHRVWQMAKRIGKAEGADMRTVELGALLHDIADWKFHGGDDTVGSKVAAKLLDQYGADQKTIDAVTTIVSQVSYKGAGVDTTPTTLEAKVVQDADRLDAIGAIGIARTFAYGGSTGRSIYDPNIKPVLHATKEEYIASNGPTINHFYEKLLLIKDRLNTEVARSIAAERHAFMEAYLAQFYAEWESEA